MVSLVQVLIVIQYSVLVLRSGYTRSVVVLWYLIESSMSKVMKSFICRCCLNTITSTGRTTVDIDASANLELMDKFCDLGDLMSIDGDVDATVEARTRIGWI